MRIKMSETGQSADQSGSESEVDVMYLWKIPIDRAYVKSIVGILKVVAALISLIAFICCASGRSDNCDDAYSSTYNYFEFVSITCFLTIIALWFFFVLTLNRRVFFKLVPWPLVELIYLAVFIIFYLIANIVIAAQSCGKDSNKAAAAFGFFALFALAGHAFFTFRDWRAGRAASSDTSAPKTPEYDADRNMEQY
nr:hypothetical protein BaRGS_021755 [Batillaria attramentaria]